jgi:transcription antitermination factor NusG
VAADAGIPFRVGQVVRFRNGAWAGFLGTIRRIDGPGRILVEGGLFGGKVPIMLPVAEIEAA